jgi:hypothetical protein
MVNGSDKFLLMQTLLQVLFEHILISLTNFIGIPNSVRILYNTSLFTELYAFSSSFSLFLTPFSGVGFFLITYGSFRHLVGLLGWGISSAPRPLPTHRTTQHREMQTHIHTLSRIQTCNPNVWVAKDSTCLRPCGHWDQHMPSLNVQITNVSSHYTPNFSPVPNEYRISHQWLIFYIQIHANDSQQFCLHMESTLRQEYWIKCYM